MTKQNTLKREFERRTKTAIRHEMTANEVEHWMNNPTMQATNHSALDGANFHNRMINQEFNH